jgi:hypothetical protein
MTSQHKVFSVLFVWAVIAQSVKRLATGWTVRISNPGGGEIQHEPRNSGQNNRPQPQLNTGRPRHDEQQSIFWYETDGPSSEGGADGVNITPGSIILTAAPDKVSVHM